MKMDPSRIISLEMNVRHLISGVGVTLLDANHCPGAVMFLFEVPRMAEAVKQQPSPSGLATTAKVPLSTPTSPDLTKLRTTAWIDHVQRIVAF